jgi:WhiB family redox-sensing transcriptional regulator
LRENPRFLDAGLGLCANEDPDLFADSSDRGAARLEREALAKAVCSRCPFRVPCKEWAIATLQVGVWGGTNGHDRAYIRRNRRAAA